MPVWRIKYSLDKFRPTSDAAALAGSRHALSDHCKFFGIQMNVSHHATFITLTVQLEHNEKRVQGLISVRNLSHKHG